MRRARRRTRRAARRAHVRTSPVRRRRRARRAFAANPPRRRRASRRAVARRSSRRGFRRNPPDLLGFNLKDVAMAGAAVVLAPFVEKQLMGLLPTSMAGTKAGRWAVKVGTAVAVGYGAKKVLGGKFGNLALIALGANLVADAVAEFAPSLTPTPAVGMYPGGSGLGYYPRGLNGGPSGAAYAGLDRSLLLPMAGATDPFKPAF